MRRTSKITPGEVESALDLHPAVAMSAVIGAPDPDGGQVPVAFVVTRPGKVVSAEELTKFLAERIAAYKIPARIHFQDHLPLTASGKIAHRELQELPLTEVLSLISQERCTCRGLGSAGSGGPMIPVAAHCADMRRTSPGAETLVRRKASKPPSAMGPRAAPALSRV